MPYREEKFRGLQFRGCEKDIFGKKKQKKQNRKREKYFIDLPPQYAVTVRILRSMCKIFIYSTSQTLISIFVDASSSNLFIALSIFQTVAWNILLTKKIRQKFKGIVTRQAFIYTLT